MNLLKRLGLAENTLASMQLQQVTKAASQRGRCCAAEFAGSLEQVSTVGVLQKKTCHSLL